MLIAASARHFFQITTITGGSLLAADLAGCARTEPSPPETAADPNVYARGICHFFARCSPAYVRSEWGTVAACVDALDREATALFGAPGARLTKRQLDACIVRTENVTCDTIIDALPECDFRGTLPDGTACASGASCVSGACFKDVSRAAADCGTCMTPALANETCAEAPCAPGLDCVAERCVAPGEAGAACSDEHRCRPTLVCVAEVCVVPRGRDEACDATGASAVPCDPEQGLACSEGTCRALLATVGSSCGQIPFCEASVCSAGVCVRRPSEGEPCSVGGPIGCAFPLDCRDGACVRADVAGCGL